MAAVDLQTALIDAARRRERGQLDAEFAASPLARLVGGGLQARERWLSATGKMPQVKAQEESNFRILMQRRAMRENSLLTGGGSMGGMGAGRTTLGV